MSKKLTITYGSMTFEMEDVGKFSWQENERGGITVSADPPGAPGTPNNPVLAGLADTLRGRSKAASEAARAKAEAEEAAAPSRQPNA